MFQEQGVQNTYQRSLVSRTTSRVIGRDDLDAATHLFLKDPDWGAFYGEKFRAEAAHVMDIARAEGVGAHQSAIVGTFSDSGKLVGVGAAFKDGCDYAYWSISWVMVDSDLRGQGLGRVVVDSLLHHARIEQEKSHNPNCRVVLSTTKDLEEWYSTHWGFRTIDTGPLEGERLMRLDLVGPGLPLKGA